MGNSVDGAIFQYQDQMMTVLAGVGSKMIPAIQNVAYVLMVICLVLGIYEAYVKGGDTRQLATTFLKYVVVAFLVANWQAFFTDLMSGFNGIAQYIDDSYGAGDLAKDWWSQLSTYWNQTSTSAGVATGLEAIWHMTSGGAAAVVTALEIAIAYIIFPIAVQIFTLLYTFWGAVLFAVGPLVLALAPSQTVNSTAKFFSLNLVVWNCWTVVYAIFACLITAVNGNDLQALLNGNNFSFVPGSQPIVMIGLTSILYALCILLIPLIAYSVLKGEFRAVGLGLGLLMGRISGSLGGALSGGVETMAGGTGGTSGTGGGGIFTTGEGTGGTMGAAPMTLTSSGGSLSQPPNPTPAPDSLTRNFHV